MPDDEPIKPPPPSSDNCCGRVGKAHSWVWKWDIAGQWTDYATCQNCGAEKLMKRDEGSLRGVSP